jgi:glycosyltransferase involved in cell wall biosynthesis
MKLLVESNAFYPSVGGIQILTRDLCEEWVQQGHDVIVQTEEPLDGEAELESLRVVRQPTVYQKLILLYWSDTYIQTSLSVKGALLANLVAGSTMFIHHEHLRTDGILRPAVQKALLKTGHSIAVSQAVADRLPVSAEVIPNPVTKDFGGGNQLDTGSSNGVKDRKGLLFVGRLVPEKGCDLAIRAVAQLRNRGEPISLTICGDGPQRSRLERLVHDNQITNLVHFEGWSSRAEVKKKMCSAQALVVPSRWAEPFGLVAMEALACHTPVVAARRGGLPEAVGSAGVLVEPEDVDALANGIRKVTKPEEARQLRSNISGHLQSHSLGIVSTQYIAEFHRVLNY